MHQVEQIPTSMLDYWGDVQPILEKRCIVCHACYDAPCQAKLTAPEGITRGANPANPYDIDRWTNATPSRLFEDAQTDEQWRQRGFHSILGHDAIVEKLSHQTEANNNQISSAHVPLSKSPMFQLLSMKTADGAQYQNQQLDSSDYSLDLYRESSCPSGDDIGEYMVDKPKWGMPYALPPVPKKEQSSLMRWLAEGALFTARPALAQPFITEIAKWELFLNAASLKSQLVNRYLYEHLYLAHLYFDDIQERQFFKLVRSSTPPGEPVNLITTRRPFDDPGTGTVYYRLVRERESIVAKSHLPYALNSQRLAFWESLFYKNNFNVTYLPDYKVPDTSNPFITFKQIPSQLRYQFLLDEARFTIMNYIKGSVCRGPVALNVIRDHFWVLFEEPKTINANKENQFLAEHYKSLELPSIYGSLSNMPIAWLTYSRKGKQYLKAKNKLQKEELANGSPLSLDYLWDGNGTNDNAALTVFRNFDSATIEKGLIGNEPETIWVIDYALLERIHYLLVAGYDVYGNLNHQLLTRLHMDFLRMEGENNFLNLLPSESRRSLRNRWYRETDNNITQYINGSSFENPHEPAVQYNTTQHKSELLSKVQQKLSLVLSQKYSLADFDQSLQGALNNLSGFSGRRVQYLPELSYINIISDNGKNSYLSLLKNNAHVNVSSIKDEASRLLPDESTVTVANGILGAYPNALLRVKKHEFEPFVQRLMRINSEQDFSALMDLYGVRRTHPDFWQISDQLHTFFQQQDPIEYGALDYMRLENR